MSWGKIYVKDEECHVENDDGGKLLLSTSGGGEKLRLLKSFRTHYKSLYIAHM